MALKALMLRKKLESAQAALDELRAKDTEFDTREAELEIAIEEAQTDEERSAVESEVEKFGEEKSAHDSEKLRLEGEIANIEDDLNAEEERAKKAAVKKPEERKDDLPVETRQKFFDMNAQERDAFFAREDVKSFIERVRSMKGETRAISGSELLIPDVVLGLIREEVARASKILPFVTRRAVRGTSRQNVAGAIPEAVWTEMCASINELNLSFTQVEMDGYKVGGYISVCNSVLEDSDIALATEIVTAIGGAIAKAEDKAILFGTGTKMPLGIATRLAQTSKPSGWSDNAPAWVDLHTTNIKTLSINSNSGVAFFEALIGALSVAKPKYSSDGLFWAMNRKTHLAIMAKALAFNSAAALTAGVNNTFPVIGGRIVEFEDSELADNEIIGGFGGNYLWVDREGATFATSSEVRFLDDQTVFKGTQRADGAPVAGEAFVIVNYANTSPTTAKTFPDDYANTPMTTLTLVAAQGASAGKTVVTVSDTVATEDPVLKYKVKASTRKLNVGDTVTGYTDLTSGTTAITAAAGVSIAVVELDGNGKVVACGDVASVPHA